MKLILRESKPVVLKDIWLVFYDSALFSPSYYLGKGYTQYDVYLVGGGGGGGSGAHQGYNSVHTFAAGGGGGGGSAYFNKNLLLGGVDVGSPIVIGAAGAGDPGYENSGLHTGGDGGTTSFHNMKAYGGNGGGGVPQGGQIVGASGGAGAGGDINAARGTWNSNDPALGGVGRYGGGSGADTRGAAGDPVSPGFPGTAYGLNVYGGGGGGAGSNGGSALDYQNKISHYGTDGGAGYMTRGAMTFAEIVAFQKRIDPTIDIVGSGGGAGGGGINVNALTGQANLVNFDLSNPLGPRDPGQGGVGGSGWADTSRRHDGEAGMPGLAVLRIHV